MNGGSISTHYFSASLRCDERIAIDEEFTRATVLENESLIRRRDRFIVCGFPVAALVSCLILAQRGYQDDGPIEFAKAVSVSRNEVDYEIFRRYWAVSCVGVEAADNLLNADAGCAAETFGSVPLPFSDNFDLLSRFFREKGHNQWALFCLATLLANGGSDAATLSLFAKLLYEEEHYLAAIPFLLVTVFDDRQEAPEQIEFVIDALVKVGLREWAVSVFTQKEKPNLPWQLIVDLATDAPASFGNLNDFLCPSLKSNLSSCGADSTSDVTDYLWSKDRAIDACIWELSDQIDASSLADWHKMATWFGPDRRRAFLAQIIEIARFRLRYATVADIDLTDQDLQNPGPLLYQIAEKFPEDQSLLALTNHPTHSPLGKLTRVLLRLNARDAAILTCAYQLLLTPDSNDLWFLLGCNLMDSRSAGAAILAFSASFGQLRYNGFLPNGELSRIGEAAMSAGSPDWAEIAFREDISHGIILHRTLSGIATAASLKGIFGEKPERTYAWLENAGLDLSDQQSFIRVYFALLDTGALVASTHFLDQGADCLSESSKKKICDRLIGDYSQLLEGKDLCAHLSLLSPDNTSLLRSLRAAMQTAISHANWPSLLEIATAVWKQQNHSLASGLLENFVSALVRLGKADEVPGYMDSLAREAGDRVIFDYPSTPESAIGKSELAKEKGIPGIVLFTMPKSASVHIWVKLSEVLDLPRTRISGTLFGVDDIAPAWAKILSRRPSICQQHVTATSANLGALTQAGLFKIVVHVRDPRQAMLSWVHHIDTEISRDKGYTLVVEDAADYQSLSLEEKISLKIESLLPDFVEYAKSWMDVHLDDTSPFEIYFTSFENMIADRESFFDNILSFYELDEYRSQKKVDATSPEFGLHHFRKGKPDEWKEVFTESQKKRAEELIPADLAEFFGWDRSSEGEALSEPHSTDKKTQVP